MDILKMNFDDSIPDIIDAYTEVFGEKYRDNIAERLNFSKNVYYFSYMGIKSYYEFLLNSKKEELKFHFLVQLGLTKDREFNCFDGLTEEEKELIHNNLICNPNNLFDKNSIGPLISILEHNKASLDDKVNCLNMIRKCREPLITKYNYYIFKKSKEYKNEIYPKINHYLEVYDALSQKYQLYEQKLEPVKNFIIAEEQRRRPIEEKKLDELYLEVESYLPLKLVEFLNSNYNSVQERRNKIFKSLMFADDIQYFYTNFNCSERMCQRYFESILGEEYFAGRTWKDLINNEEIKSLIPSSEAINKITECTINKLREYDRDTILSGPIYEKNLDLYSEKGINLDLEKKLGPIQYVLVHNLMCVTTFMNEDYSYLNFGYTNSTAGYIDYLFLHELSHLTQVRGFKNAGFETIGALREYTLDVSPVLGKRPFECLNEAFTDFFALEARDVLHQKGIYFAEPKEHTKKDVSDKSVKPIFIEMLKPLFENYRPEIIEAIIAGNMDALFEKIGFENFIELNNLFNKVDYLLVNGLETVITANETQNPLFIDYYKVMEDLKELYKSMGNNVMESPKKNLALTNYV